MSHLPGSRQVYRTAPVAPRLADGRPLGREELSDGVTAVGTEPRMPRLPMPGGRTWIRIVFSAVRRALLTYFVTCYWGPILAVQRTDIEHCSPLRDDRPLGLSGKHRPSTCERVSRANHNMSR